MNAISLIKVDGDGRLFADIPGILDAYARRGTKNYDYPETGALNICG